MKKRILAVCLAATACILLSTTIQTRCLQQSMAQKVLRFHVLANSDSTEDQELKRKVRDRVGSVMADKLKDAKTLDDSTQVVEQNLCVIEDCAAAVIEEEGYCYPVRATLENCMFPEKTYGAYTFPGGEYEALRVVIGSGEGHNWWCVMYPNLCFANSMYEVDEDSGEKLREVLEPTEYAAVLENGNFKVRFKMLGFLNRVLE
ncbi:stage II sporulation protein R [uncultured Eubacterium sp.]|uniref:stage II sporulation protein R n=1 Tax=uncultured Eubacterium sp. TaxID=165185 RepID=UPI0025F14B88|nr:stage II sporulation protein R [uncultured Eubacterium sp.]